MATKSGFAWDESMKAAADLSTKQYYIVEQTVADTVNVCNAAADIPWGVLQNKPLSGGAAQVRMLGISMVVSDGSGTAIAVNDWIGPNSSGVAVKKATADYSVCGIAMDASSASGTVIRVRLIGPGFFRTAGG
jgi:hypothetical protein